jgi:hypothetical protein
MAAATAVTMAHGAAPPALRCAPRCSRAAALTTPHPQRRRRAARVPPPHADAHAAFQPAAAAAAASRGGNAGAHPRAAPLGVVATGADSAALLSALGAEPAAEPATEAGAAPFDWARHWYAIAALDALDPDVPTAVTVLGERIALWCDASGEWRALRDACPHRLAPLSEGRVAEDGTLQVRRMTRLMR